MAKLIYFMPTSLDGYIADETGNPDWAAPDEEVFAFINDLVRPIGMYLYGRKIYETMAIWETPDVIPGLTSGMLDFARISKITGVICGYRVEEIEDKLMQQIRYLDKLVDELARGKAMDKILRK